MKSLRDISPKSKSDTPDKTKKHLEGTNSSKTRDGSTGSDPGVDYDPKAPEDQKFVKLHKTQEHEERTGNKEGVRNSGKVKYSMDDSRMKNYGHKRGKDEGVYEAAECNHTPAGKDCPVHGMKECTGYGMKDTKGSKKLLLGGKKLDEVLTKKTSVSAIIHDFVHSKNPKFAGKSVKERQRMALGAYYNMHPEKSRNEAFDPTADDTEDEISMVTTELKAIIAHASDLLKNMPGNMHIAPWVQAKIANAKMNISSVHDYIVYGNVKEAVEPLLGEDGKKKKKMKEDAGPGQIYPSKGVPNKTANYGAGDGPGGDVPYQI